MYGKAVVGSGINPWALYFVKPLGTFSSPSFFPLADKGLILSDVYLGNYQSTLSCTGMHLKPPFDLYGKTVGLRQTYKRIYLHAILLPKRRRLSAAVLVHLS